MGAVTFSIDERLLRCLKEALPLSAFVETGTFKGDAVAIAMPYVERVVTVESSQPLWEEAVRRFSGNVRVEALLGDSAEVLARIRPSLGDTSTLFWLDAHWCVADNTAGDHSQCPLLAEISAVGTLGDTSVILIDDARLFLAPPPEPHDVTQWPTFDQIVLALRRLSDRHDLMVVNDVIAFYPRSIEDSVAQYARHHGVDWLRARQSLAENVQLRAENEEKEALIHRLHLAAGQMAADLKEKEAALAEKEAALAEKEAALAEKQAALAEKQAELAEKQAALVEKQAALVAKDASLMEKEAVIRELDGALRAYRSAFFVAGPAMAVVARIGPAARRLAHTLRRPLGPRLGNLNQHAPRPLRLPPRHSRIEGVAPRISIVTPSFQQAAFIERTMTSVLEQGYPDLEYHVQDGASSDGTREILERYTGRLTSWDSARDSGQTEAINRGFARTTGEIMAWLNSDDVLFPGALAYVADFFNRNPHVDVVYGHRVLIDEDDREIGRWILPAHSDEALSWADFVPQETLFWRRRIWDKAGGRVDESFRFAMDWDLLVRFRDAGARFARVPRFLGGFRIHARQKTSAVISEVGFQEMNRIRERIHGRVPTGLEVRKALAPYLFRHVLADLAWRIRPRPD